MKSVPGSRYVVFFVVAVVGSAFDIVSKNAVFRDLGYPARHLPPFAVGEHRLFPQHPLVEGESSALLEGWVQFRLFTSFNAGALWGFGQGLQLLFVVLGLLAIAAVLYWLFGYGAARSLWLTACLALIIAGTIGNLYDRAGLHGCEDPTGNRIYAVRDFLLFTFGGWPWPVFNFADVFLVTGASMLVLQSLLLEFGLKSAPADRAATAPPATAADASPPAAAASDEKLAG
jgi:signal peptidase II